MESPPPTTRPCRSADVTAVGEPGRPAGTGGYVYLARHGETRWNTLGRRQGRADSPLTSRGRRQAHLNAESLRGSGIGMVFTSPLGRAADTARIAADALGTDVMALDDLSELDHGEFTGWTLEEMTSRFPEEMARRLEDRYNWSFPGGESYRDVDHRADLALRAIHQHAGTAAILVVAHEMMNRMLLRHLLDLTPAEGLALGHPHDVVYVVDPRRGTMGELRPPSPRS